MPLPSNFSPWEHLQDAVKLVHNRRVREEFSDAADDDLADARASLKVACTLKDDDSAMMVMIRMWLFYVILQQASAMHPPMYTTPTDRYQQEVKFAPQVTLYFREDLDEVEAEYKPIDAELSFRLVGESYSTFTPSEAMRVAQKIKDLFCAGGLGIRWKKGRVKLHYRDKDNGYQFSVNAYTEAEGRELINRVLQVQGHTFNTDALSIVEMAALPPTIPSTEMIYGQRRRLPRKRPVGNVRFRHAEVHVWGIDKAITLVDATLRRANPLLRA